MQHLIRKQVLELELSRKADAFEIQQTASRYYRVEILPLLEEIFDELSTEEETLFIDRLEINLGRISAPGMGRGPWKTEILSLVKQHIHKSINKEIKNKRGHRESKSVNDCLQWLYYMEKGCLPWNTVQPDPEWYFRVLEALAVDFRMINELRKMISGRPDIVKRIVWQHDEAFLIKLVEIITAKNQHGLSGAVNELQEAVSRVYLLKGSSILPKELKEAVWGQIILSVAVGNEKPTWEQIMEKIILFYLPEVSLLEEAIESRHSRPKLILPLIKRLKMRPEVFSEENKSLIMRLFSPKESEKVEKNEMTVTVQIPDEGLFVSHAGIVLIHAFLPALFKRLDWISEGNFQDRVMAQKAIHLLHYLAAGSLSSAEHELVIPKVLCGRPLKMPVEKEVALSKIELEDADNMLQAAIEQWAVLKNTSITGLREGFLQRKGKLFTKYNNLYLQVESHSIDVLLDQLPWNLSIVKLPWMGEILRVEWR